MSESVFGYKKPEESPGFLLWQTTITWQRLIKKTLDTFNISHAQFVILAITLWHEKNGQNVLQNQIIRYSKLDKMTVSKALKNLATQGYIKREESADDTRAKFVFLTKKGKELAISLVPIIEKIDEKYFRALNKADRLCLINALNQVIVANN